MAGTDRSLDGWGMGAAEPLREPTEVLKSILHSIGDGVVVADAQAKFVLFNPGAEQILGIGSTNATPDQWSQRYGLFMTDGVTPCPPDEVPLVRAIRGATVDGAEFFVRHAGLPQGAWISLTGRPLRDAGARRAAAWWCSGTSPRNGRRRQPSVKAGSACGSWLRAPSIMPSSRSTPTATWSAGTPGRSGSRATATRRSSAGTSPAFTPPEALAQGWPEHELQVAAERGRFEDEGWRVRKDGSRFWANVVITALRNGAGQLEGFSKLTRDLTERKRAEDLVRRRNDELEQRVRERTAELARANRELMLKNQENETFVYSVSHDLRSPLVNLQGFSKELGLVGQDLRALLSDSALPPTVRERGLALLDGDMAEAIRFIQTAVRRLSSIIDALLRLSRAGRVVYQWRPVDVAGIVARVVEAMRGTNADRKAEVVVHELPPAWGDPTAVEQVFANFIGNALNYLDRQRPGCIEVASLDAQASGDPGPRAALRTYYVKDNGPGVPAPHRAKIFQAFQRVHPEAAPGEEIGLAIVQRLVERHGGKVWVESHGEPGSTFFLTLPTAAVPELANGDPGRDGPGQNHRSERHDRETVGDSVGRR